jgi:hypothetical protein
LSKVPVNIPDPQKPESIIKGVTDVSRVVDGEIEFGHPQNPYDDQDTTLAGAGTPTTHNGSVQNIKGSWVEITLGTGDLAGTGAVTCTHNLNIPVINTEPNVRWIVMGWKVETDIVVADDTSLSVFYDETDAASITADAMPLRFGSNLTVTDANPVDVCLFFIPAVRWAVTGS